MNFDGEAHCLLCGWRPVAIPADILAEFETRRGLDQYGRANHGGKYDSRARAQTAVSRGQHGRALQAYPDETRRRSGNRRGPRDW